MARAWMVWLFFSLGFGTEPKRAQPVTLRMAAIAPPGTSWSRLLVGFADEVERDTHGQVHIKWLLGGVAGDEHETLEKVRRGELAGLAGAIFCQDVAPSLHAFEVAGLAQNDDEAYEMMTRLRPLFDEEARATPFAFLALSSGFGHRVLFTRTPVRTLADMRAERIWVYELDEVERAQLALMGMNVVPLPLDQAGHAYDGERVDGFVSIPWAAIAYRYGVKARYFTDLSSMFLPGCMIVSRAAVSQLDGDAQNSALRRRRARRVAPVAAGATRAPRHARARVSARGAHRGADERIVSRRVPRGGTRGQRAARPAAGAAAAGASRERHSHRGARSDEPHRARAAGAGAAGVTRGASGGGIDGRRSATGGDRCGGAPRRRRCRHCAVALPAAPRALGDELEYPVKAEYIERFTHFIEWPPTAFEGPDAPLRPVRHRRYPADRAPRAARRAPPPQGAPVELRALPPNADVSACHLVFIAADERPYLKQILSRVEGRPIVTVADSQGFARAGVLINLLRDGKGASASRSRRAARARARSRQRAAAQAGAAVPVVGERTMTRHVSIRAS